MGKNVSTNPLVSIGISVKNDCLNKTEKNKKIKIVEME